LVLLSAGVAAALGGIVFTKRHEQMLIDRAEKALPGPLKH
jgi:hypothetical protein